MSLALHSDRLFPADSVAETSRAGFTSLFKIFPLSAPPAYGPCWFGENKPFAKPTALLAELICAQMLTEMAAMSLEHRLTCCGKV